MFQIDDALVHFDVIERYFACDLSLCEGMCCVEGDSGAPLEEAELAQLQKVLPVIWDDLSPQAQAVVREQGVAYIDAEGDTVTSIVDGKDCVFAYHEADGICKCAIEKAYREGKTDFHKPISCHLYPIRVTQYRDFKAVNFNRWNICKAADILGKKKNTRVYQFLKEPLIRQFGEAWYKGLARCAEEWLRQKGL